MNLNPILNKITIYPIKSLDGTSLQQAQISEGGCLQHDREFAMKDEHGTYINGKTNPLVHTLRSNVDFETETISFRLQNETEWNQFHFIKDKDEIESYLTNYFGIKTKFHQNKTGRFLDIPDISGATVLSTSSLKAVSEWYDIDLDETRKRFRATLELEGVPEFWEDRLFSHMGKSIEFKIGDVTMIGIKPRARCVVPTRNPETGEAIHAFPKSFARHRAATLPEWSTLDEYDHHYYLTADCHIPETEIGKWIATGEKVVIVGEKR